MKSKNDKLLKSFVKYCKKHPDLRFWQALCNWSEWNKIFTTMGEGQDFHDTFYFNGKRS